MSFGAREASSEGGSPIDLFLFRYGQPDSAVLAFTDAEQDIADAPADRPGLFVTYKAIAIERDEVQATGTMDRATIDVRTSDDSALADLFRLYPPSHVVTLVLRQGHAGDPDEQFLVAWSGRVTAFNSDENEARFTCEPISTSLKRIGLRRRWQRGCPHWLYGPQCKASKEAATETHVVLAVLGAQLTFAEDWTEDPRKAKFQGGLAEWTLGDGRNEIRTILRSNEDGTIILGGPATGLEAGDSVALSLGCNHLAGVALQPEGDCGPLHDNILNFGGQMWIPFKSPVGLTNNFW